MTDKTLQDALKSLYYSLGGDADKVRGTDDLNAILAEISALGLGKKISDGGGGEKPDTGVVTIAAGLLARNVDGVITIDFAAPFVSVASEPGEFKTLSGAKLPAAFRPLAKIRCPISINGNFAELVFNPGGDIQQVSPVAVAAGSAIRGAITYTG